MASIQNRSISDREKLLSYLGTNAYCSERYKILYIATPKVACTTLKWWFADLEGYGQSLRNLQESVESDPDSIIHDTFHKVAPSMAGLSSEALVEPLTSDAYFRFALVRNPYKRIFSAWQSKLLLREPLQATPYLNCSFYNQQITGVSDIAVAFEGFLEHLASKEAPEFLDVHWTPQANLLRPDLIRYSKVTKIENVEELSAALSERIGHKFSDPFATRHANESLLPYRLKFITKRCAELIRNMYADDFEVFGYSTQLQEDAGVFTKGQVDLAIKAISMVRGRHHRIGEMGARSNNLSQFIAERDGQIASLNQAVTERDGQIASLNQAVTERDGQIASLNQAVTERDGQIASLNQAVTERDGQIASLNQAVTERDGQIASLNGSIKETLISTSWRLTRPLRWIGRRVHRAAHVMRLARQYMNH